RFYSALAGNGEVDGVHLLSPELIARASAEQVYGDDIVLQRPTRFGLGFQLTMAERRLGPSPRAFGHFGAGGSLGFADPDSRLARLRWRWIATSTTSRRVWRLWPARSIWTVASIWPTSTKRRPRSPRASAPGPCCPIRRADRFSIRAGRWAPRFRSPRSQASR